MMEKFFALKYWREAISIVGYTLNHVQVKKGTHSTPFELWYGYSPNVKYFKVFRSKCFFLKYFRIGKLDAKSEEGIFLLNSTLTVERGIANSHSEYGYQHFTNRVIQLISEHNTNVVFMLWGNVAKQTQNFISNKDRHLILTEEHPAAAAYRNEDWHCEHFKLANDYFINNNLLSFIYNISVFIPLKGVTLGIILALLPIFS